MSKEKIAPHVARWLLDAARNQERWLELPMTDQELWTVALETDDEDSVTEFRVLLNDGQIFTVRVEKTGDTR